MPHIWQPFITPACWVHGAKINSPHTPAFEGRRVAHVSQLRVVKPSSTNSMNTWSHVNPELHFPWIPWIYFNIFIWERAQKVWGEETLSKIYVFIATGSDSLRLPVGMRAGICHISPPCGKMKIRDLSHQENSILPDIVLLLMWIPSSSGNTATIAAFMLNNP